MKQLHLIFTFVFAVLSYGQTPSASTSSPLSETSPTDEGMSPERLEQIDLMLQQAVGKNNIPGAVALIARNGKIVFHKAYGKADNALNRTMEKNTIFRIASQTKAITSTAVMMLWEEGKFRLDDPISKYIPDFGKAEILDTFNESDSTYTTKPAENQITIRHLLSHTSGLGYGVIDGDERFQKIYAKAGITDLFTTENISIGESVKKLAKLPLHHNPGDAYVYSEGLDVLGYFIEVVSGMPFDEFLRERLFDPLGMDDTWFYLPEEKKDRLVTVQRKGASGWEKYPVTFYDPDYPVKGARRFFSGGAGLSSTAKDYATFLQMYLNDGELNGKRILSRTTVRSIMGNQTGELWGNGIKHYGLAFGVVTAKGQDHGGEGSVGTFDWGGYFNTQYFADPQENIIGILMKQTRGPVEDQTGWKFRQMVFAAVDD
ncbi:serine hydrolase [Ulvibacterium sp.]|uniref:serine hydrolase domain-containing protein n=1 Tax=Ulvibacterium sp. TaxID=2665914 RepID=UPI0026276DD9|nr:serine hydrolase domain-containing protein [Ulvibacterium sp.]